MQRSLRKIFDEADEGRVDLEGVMRLVGRHLFHYSRVLTGRQDLAEDVVQDVLVELLEKGQQLRSIENPKGWLFTVLRRRALRVHAHMLRETPLDLLSTVELDFNRRMEVQEVWVRLTRQEKEVALLHIWEGLSFSETAQVLGMPRGTVLSCYHRAIRRLRDEFGVLECGLKSGGPNHA